MSGHTNLLGTGSSLLGVRSPAGTRLDLAGSVAKLAAGYRSLAHKIVRTRKHLAGWMRRPQ